MPDVRVFDRVPNEPDARDYRMADYLTVPPSLTAVDAALATMTSPRKAPSTDRLFAWAQAVTTYLHLLTPGPTPNPIPVPPAPVPPPPVSRVWIDIKQLDQGETGHCVGFGWAQWGNTDPIEDIYTDADANAIYYECKVFDGEPLAENGSQVRSGAKAMKARGKLAVYVFATTIDEIKAWVLSNGPVVVGTDFTADMMEPSPTGLVHPTGASIGGHCYIITGYDTAADLFTFQNSWGSAWGVNGRFFMQANEFAGLFANLGDACAATEIGTAGRQAPLIFPLKESDTTQQLTIDELLRRASELGDDAEALLTQ